MRKPNSKLSRKPPALKWWIYIARCADGSLYCGIAKDVARRIGEHNASRKAARYTRSRRPVALVWAQRSSSQSAALKREYAIKRMRRAAKESLILRGGCFHAIKNRL